MTARRDPESTLRKALAAILVLALATLFAACELHRLSVLRMQEQALSEGNLEELRVSADAADLITREQAAIRELIVADEATDVQGADARYEAIGRRYDAVQMRLTGLFAVDPQTTDGERVLLHRLQAEQLATIAPLERLVTLALRNHDDEATALLNVDVMPHLEAILAALAELDAVQQRQNVELAQAANEDYHLALLSTAALASLASVAIVASGWIFVRRAAGRTTRGKAS